MKPQDIQTPTTPKGWRDLAKRYALACRTLSANECGEKPVEVYRQFCSIRTLVGKQLGKTPVTLCIGAHGACEYEAPAYAAIKLEPKFFEQIQSLAKLVKDAGLADARVWYAPEWDDDFRVECARLQVSADDWCIEGVERHVGYSISTAAVEIDPRIGRAHPLVQGRVNG